MVELTDPVRRARALAVLGNKLASERERDGDKRHARLREAISRCSEAAGVWSRDAAPRKWPALMCNISSAHLEIAVATADAAAARAALGTLDAALDALDPDKEPWCHAAIWSARLAPVAEAKRLADLSSAP